MSESRRVLYVGNLQSWSTAFHRKTSLEQLGLVVAPFDTYRYETAGARLARSVQHRLASGPAVSALNRELVSAADSACVDWIWIDKGIWVTPQTLERLAAPGRRLIHYAGDPLIMFHRTRHFISSIPKYDVLLTTKEYEVALYQRYGARRVISVMHGYDPELFRPRRLSAEESSFFASDVCFVGHCEPHYRRRIAAAAATGAEIAVWGRWQRAAATRPWLGRLVRGPGVWGEEYVAALNSAKIGLGLLTRLAPDSSTTRTFEIPACGTFLLAERSTEHSQLFVEGREAEFFDSDDEMREKIAWYLQHDVERERIAAAGYRKCVQAGYSYLDRLRGVISAIR